MSDQQTPAPTAPPEPSQTSPSTPVQASGQEPSQEPADGARRYPRTFRGLIASMVVLVVALVGFWIAQNATHDSVPADNMTVAHWKGDVAQVQTVADPVYPGSIPSGWTVTSADWAPGGRPLWKLGVVTPDNQFVGIYQQQVRTPYDLVAQTASEGGARQTGTATIHTAVGSSWTTWTDVGGDHIYVTKIGSTTVVVYGTDDGDVRRFLGVLTTRKLPKRLQNEA